MFQTIASFFAVKTVDGILAFHDPFYLSFDFCSENVDLG